MGYSNDRHNVSSYPCFNGNLEDPNPPLNVTNHLEKPISFDALQELLAVNVSNVDPSYKFTAMFAEASEAEFLRN